MKRRSSSSAKKKKPSATDLLTSPPPAAASPTVSPPQFDFTNIGAAFSSKVPVAVTSTPAKGVGSIGDLKEMACLKMEGIKRHLDRSHSEILKDIDSSHSRLHKRFKIQTQACQQVMEEAEKEYKKMSERINESKESLKVSYSEFIAEAQASASRVCKSSIPELSQSFDRTLDALRGRYGAAM